MFGAGVRCVVVVGAQWGDEGKGKVVDALAERAAVVVRYQGGANAGHTVDAPGGSFVLHQIPSGILRAGCRCVIGNGVVLDPEALFEEIEALASRGVSVEGRLLVSDRAHLVLPYHKLLDSESPRSREIGTTSRGIGPAYEDKIGRRGLRVADLGDPNETGAIVRAGCERANAVLRQWGSPKEADPEAVVRALLRLAPRLAPFVADAGKAVWTALQGGANVLLEGAQGALLDVDHGTYPFVTSSNTTAGGAAAGAGIGPTAIHAVLGVVKAYATRVGNGPFPSEAEAAVAAHLRTLGGEFGATTGRPRRCGWFDAVVVRYAARVNGLAGLAVTKLDILDTVDPIPVCTHYELDGARLDDFPVGAAGLERVRPVYEFLPGWNRPLGGVRAMADLPRSARRYVERIEALAATPVRFVGVGTGRGQLIEVT